MTEPEKTYLVALFHSVSHVIQAERLLKKAGVPHKVIPVPRELSSDCGVCIRFSPEHREALEDALTGKIEFFSLQSLQGESG